MKVSSENTPEQEGMLCFLSAKFLSIPCLYVSQELVTLDVDPYKIGGVASHITSQTGVLSLVPLLNGQNRELPVLLTYRRTTNWPSVS